MMTRMLMTIMVDSISGPERLCTYVHDCECMTVSLTPLHFEMLLKGKLNKRVRVV